MLVFGNLPVRIRRILYHGLSPVEQRAWAKLMTHKIPNLGRRTLIAAVPMIPGLTMSIGIYIFAPIIHRRKTRKDPKLYENDK